MWEDVKRIIYRLFGIEPKETDTERTKEDVRKYQDISKENLTAVFANALSVLAFADSSVSVTAGNGDTPNKRSKYLNEAAKKQWQDMKQNIAVGNGCGMIASIPYSVVCGGKRKIYIDTVTKDRFFITGIQGDEITKCTVIADIQKRNHQIYLRWTDYSLENGVYVIRQKATRNGNEVSLASVPEWAEIAPEIRIGNVTKLPIGIYTCPASNRRPKKTDGVPITFGCEATMERISECLRQIEKEYKNKGVRIFADGTLFDKDMKLSDIYIKTRAAARLGNTEHVDVFDPAFRDTALYNRLEHLFAQLEKEVGTSRGILTDLQTSGATATEVKRAAYQTFALCDDIHVNTERYFKDLIYGIDVLCEFYGITPPGEYEVVFDWSYSMLEDPQQTFNQLMQARSIGAVDISEIRQFVIDGESMEEAKKKVQEIKESNPSMVQLMGDE